MEQFGAGGKLFLDVKVQVQLYRTNGVFTYCLVYYLCITRFLQLLLLRVLRTTWSLTCLYKITHAASKSISVNYNYYCMSNKHFNF